MKALCGAMTVLQRAAQALTGEPGMAMAMALTSDSGKRTQMTLKVLL